MKWFLSNVYLFLIIGFFPSVVSSQEYIPLVGIPGLNDSGDMTTQNYVNALYVIAISVAAFLAVGRLIFAGVKYIATDIIPGKEQAKKDIKNAILGLLVVIGAVLILNTINPQLTNLDALSRIETVTTEIETVRVVNEGGEGTGSTGVTSCPDGQVLVRGSGGGGGRSGGGGTTPNRCEPAPTTPPGTTPGGNTRINIGDQCGAVGVVGQNTDQARCADVTLEETVIEGDGYLFYEPAIPGVEPEGPAHNQPANVVSYIGNGFVVVERTDGIKAIVGCDLIRPLPRQCI